jgi:hypothetical protein
LIALMRLMKIFEFEECPPRTRATRAAATEPPLCHASPHAAFHAAKGLTLLPAGAGLRLAYRQQLFSFIIDRGMVHFTMLRADEVSGLRILL